MKNNPRLIGISGKKESGKDQFYRYLLEICPEYKNHKFADKLKRMGALLTGQPIDYFYNRNHYADFLVDWGMTIREFMQKLGTEAIRTNLHQDAWVIALMSEFNEHSKWVLTDVRFENEADAVLKQGGILVRINRDSLDTNDQHPSETSLDNFDKFDYVIENDGTLKDFKNKVIEFCKIIKE